MGTSAVFAIKSEYASRIYSGEKQFEFRKRKAVSDLDYIVIYEPGAMGVVTGAVPVSEVKEGTPDEIWEQTKQASGISRKAFEKYFGDSKIAYAYCLGLAIKLKDNLLLNEIGVKRAPQFFQYVDTGIIEKKCLFDCEA